MDALERRDGHYLVTAGTRHWEADNVVIATGAFRDPRVPSFAADLDPAIRQLHSSAYRGPEQLRDGPVLVVGAAHSGADIAHEVAATRPTILSGPSTGELPFRCDGPIARFAMPPILRFVATRVLTVRTPMGRKARVKVRKGGGPLLRYRSPELRAAGVERVLEHTTGVLAGKPMLEDGRSVDVANVIWCTGFRNGYDWVRCGLAFGDDGFPEQERGAAKGCPGLFFCRPAVPGLLRIDARRGRGPRRRAGGAADRGARGRAALGRPAPRGFPAARRVAPSAAARTAAMSSLRMPYIASRARRARSVSSSRNRSSMPAGTTCHESP